MPGSRLPGLPAQFLGSGDGHSCVPFRFLTERILIAVLRQSSPASTAFVLASGRGRSTLTPLLVAGPRPEERCPLWGRDFDNQGFPEMPFGALPERPPPHGT